MPKPFTITNAMREQVANTLTLRAVAQHGHRLAIDLDVLNDKFWEIHRSKVQALPGLDKKHWSELIQAGAVAAIATVFPTYKEERGEGHSPKTRTYLAAKIYYNDEARNALVYRLLNSSAFEGVKRFILAEKSGYEHGWKIHLVSPTGSVPRLYGIENIDDPVLDTLAKWICKELDSVIEAAVSFRAQAMDVLRACRTSRQVEDLFPEAAKLLPQPVKNETALAPTELAANVRNMLSKGVPPVLAQA